MVNRADALLNPTYSLKLKYLNNNLNKKYNKIYLK